MKRIALVVLLVALAAPAWGAPPQALVRNGDIVFQRSRSSQSPAIQRATGSPYSHVGLILLRGGKPYVFEAGPTVRFTPLQEWIAQGRGGHYVVKRLRNAETALGKEAVRKIRAQARLFEGKAYDAAFDWSDDRMYCSELVWKVYHRALGVRLGRLRKLREFRLDDPVVAQALTERYGSRVPLEEWVISPADIYRSEQIVTVKEK